MQNFKFAPKLFKRRENFLPANKPSLVLINTNSKCIELKGQREENSSASSKTTLHGLFSPSIICCPNALHFSLYRFLRILYSNFPSGQLHLHLPFSRRLIFNPINYSQSFYGYQDGHDEQDLVLLQTFLGLSLSIGNFWHA